MSNNFQYFAYGSNMCTRRLAERTPSLSVIGTAFIAGHRLTFDKVSKDGSGKCDIEPTGNTADRVWGVLFSIASDEASALDLAEGLGHGYRKGEVEAITPAGVTLAVAYFATQKDQNLLPYDWYKQFVIAGATEHNLGSEYLATISNAPSKPDLDKARREKNQALLSST